MLPEKDIKDLKNNFEYINKEGTGMISKEEMKE